MTSAGAGWAWLRADDGRALHLTGEGGPRGPLTAVVTRVPVLRPGQRVALDPDRARPWRTPPPAPPAPPSMVADACAAVAGHGWNDPWARALGREPLEAVLPRLAGRGPGLTPAGDDALLGYVLARRALLGAGARPAAACVLRIARARSGGLSLALLRQAARGEAAEPAAAMRDALLRADGAALGAAVRRLAGYGRTTGRAILTGLIAGLAPAAPA